MRALVKTASGPGHVELVEWPEPVPGPGQVVVEVQAAGVCGTDLHIEAAEYPSEPPVAMGHEVSGAVTDVADGVDRSWLGRRVVVETFFATCGHCPYCRDGRPNLCPQRRSIGTHVDGGFADRLAVPAANLHQVPEWLDPHTAALAEPLACVCNCLLDPPVVHPGDVVLVTGPGPMGLLAAQVARTMGGQVVVAGLPRDAQRLAVAQSLGFETRQTPPDPGSADVVVECSGSAGGATTCLRSARPGGHYVQVGVFGGDVMVPLDRVFYAELLFSSGFASTPRSWRRAMGLIDSKAVELAPLVTRAAALESWSDVFADLRNANGLKVVLDPRM